MPPDKPRYRIKGLASSWEHRPAHAASHSSPSQDQDAKSTLTRLGGNSTETFLAAATRALGPVTLGDYVQGIPELGLRQAWPTCAFFEASKAPSPIKKVPLALGHLMMGPETGFQHIFDEASRQEKTTLKLRELLELAQTEKVPVSSAEGLPPVAAAIAAQLFRGSSWFRRNQADLFSAICTSPEAAYIALLSGVWTLEKCKLALAVAKDPRLSFQVKMNSSLYAASIHISLKDIFQRAPHLWCHSPNRNILGGNEGAWKNLVDAADIDLRCASLVFGLAPQAD
jgi:hypothetical protein